MRVRIVLVRHGQSCSNMLPIAAGAPPHIRSLRPGDVLDPGLTSPGRQRLVEIGERVLRILTDSGWFSEGVHILGSSVLRRAIESAYWLTLQWPKKPPKIGVFPFLAEDTSRPIQGSPLPAMEGSADAFPMPLREQMARLQGQGILEHVDYSPVRHDPRLRVAGSDIHRFVRDVLPHAVARVVQDREPANALAPVNVVLVSHGNAITRFLGYFPGLGPSITNGASYRGELTVDMETLQVVTPAADYDFKLLDRPLQVYPPRWAAYCDCEILPWTEPTIMYSE